VILATWTDPEQFANRIAWWMGLLLHCHHRIQVDLDSGLRGRRREAEAFAELFQQSIANLTSARIHFRDTATELVPTPRNEPPKHESK
jgi:hypothetical protein